MSFLNKILGRIKELGSSVDGGSQLPEALTNPSLKADFIRFADLLPYLVWMPDRELFGMEGAEPEDPAAIGFCIEMVPQTGAPMEMAELISSIFTYLPAGSTVQWSLLGTPLIQDYLHAYVQSRLDPDTAATQEERERRELFRALAQKQADYFSGGAYKSLIQSQPYLLRDFRLVMSVNIPASSFTDENVLAKVVSLKEMCVATLKTYYQFDHVWDADDLIKWCSIILNPQDSFIKPDLPRIQYDEDKPLKRQIVSPNTLMRVTEHGLMYGTASSENHVSIKSMSVRSYPKAISLNMMGNMIGDFMQPSVAYSSPFMITIGLQVQDFEEQKNITQMRSARATQKAESPMARFMPELQEIQRDWEIAMRAYDEGTGTVRMYHQLLLFAKPQDMPRAVQAAQAVWRAQQFELVEDTYMQLQGLMSSLPMTLTPAYIKELKTAQRLTTKTTLNAVNMAPLLGEWHGVGRPIVPLWGRRGQAMTVDLFANTSGNFNGVICGTSGSGKSVFLNSLALSYLGIGGRVWIIDIGRSFEKLCHTVGGQYLEFAPEADIRLNPFSMVENIEDDLEMLIPLFAQMISPSKPLDDYCLRQLGLHLLSVWYEKGIDASVDDLAYSLINNCEKGGPNPQAVDDEWVQKIRSMSHEERRDYCDPRIRDLGVQLFPYTTDGHYGRYFVGETNVNFDNDLVVLELEELSGKKDLQAVILFLLMYRITQNMYLTRDKPKLCILDEAWALLGAGSSGEFIENGYRRARKYNGSFCAATQSIADFSQSKAAEAAIANADWMFLLRQKPESILSLEKTDKLMVDEHTKKMLLSIKTSAGEYSEVFVHGGQMGYGIGRVIFDPFTLLLVSSKAEDFEAVRYYRNQGLTIVEAIEAVLSDRGVPGYQRKTQRVA